jgi:hypothetical protein
VDLGQQPHDSARADVRGFRGDTNSVAGVASIEVRVLACQGRKSLALRDSAGRDLDRTRWFTSTSLEVA